MGETDKQFGVPDSLALPFPIPIPIPVSLRLLTDPDTSEDEGWLSLAVVALAGLAGLRPRFRFLLLARGARETSPSVNPARVAWMKAWNVCLRAEAVPLSRSSTQLVCRGVEGADWGASQG